MSTPNEEIPIPEGPRDPEEPQPLETQCCPHCQRSEPISSFLKISATGEVQKRYKSCSVCRANATDFYRKNRERILEKKDFQECECGMMISQPNMSTHRKRSVTHRRFLSMQVGKDLTKAECVELNKEIRDKHRKPRLDPNEKIVCECGSVILRKTLTLHKTTKKHKYYEMLNKIIETEKVGAEGQEEKDEEPDFFYIET